MSHLARNQAPVARLRWALLPHIGFYCEGTEHWRWWMRTARAAWNLLGWIPGSEFVRLMCGCLWNVVCRRCERPHLNDLAVSFGDVDPPTRAEEQYAETNAYTDSVVVPALAAA